MATTVYEVETLSLGDIEIEMRPLKIARLRKFMSTWTSLPEAENDEVSFDILTNLIVIALEQYSPDHADKDFIEENLDMDQYRKVIKSASGIDMGDGSGNV